jgi:hypothetical protein
MKRWLTVAALSAVSIFAACGGGGGSPPAAPPPPPPPPPPPVDQALGGVWAGVLTFDMSLTSELFVGLATDDGRFRFLSGESSTQFTGLQQVSQSDVAGSGDGYADTGTTWLDNSTVTVVTTGGTIVERDTFSGTWSNASGESGSFDFFYDALYERPSSLPLLEGTWTAYDDFGVPAATFTFDALGQFNGQNVSGCVSSGQISIIDASYNVYDVASTITNCFIAGDYSGLAIIGDLNATNDAMVLTIGNDMRGIVLELEK